MAVREVGRQPARVANLEFDELRHVEERGWERNQVVRVQRHGRGHLKTREIVRDRHDRLVPQLRNNMVSRDWLPCLRADGHSHM